MESGNGYRYDKHLLSVLTQVYQSNILDKVHRKAITSSDLDLAFLTYTPQLSMTTAGSEIMASSHAQWQSHNQPTESRPYTSTRPQTQPTQSVQ